MPKYELIYFNNRGGGELIRYVFALGGQEYTDTRLTQEEWQERKPSSLFGSLPELRIDDKPLCQRAVIARCIARTLDLMGSGEKDQVYIEMLMSCVDDIGLALYLMWIEKDEDRKAALMKKTEEKLEDLLPRLEKFLLANNGGDGWFVGESATLADISIYDCLSWVRMINKELVAKFPKLLSHNERFEKIPQIADWIAKRPKTDQ